jgi:hypothetical protein
MKATLISRGVRVLRGNIRRPFCQSASKGETESVDHFQIIRDLQDNFSVMMDKNNKYGSIRLETLLDQTETSNEVRILTIPQKFILTSTSTFDKVRNILSGSRLVFNFDPTNSLQINRKIFHLDQISNLRRDGNQLEGQNFQEQLQNMSSTELDEGFYRNIFNLDFAEESEFDIRLFKSIIHNGVKRHEDGSFPSAQEKSKHLLQIAQFFLWENFISTKDFFFLNSNIKFIFEYALLQGFDNGKSWYNQR